jgi:predicted nucleic acid-binding protein
MGTQFLIDTNIGIYLINGSMGEHTLRFIEPIINDNYHLSVITKMELLGFAFSDANRFLDTQSFVNNGVVVALSEEIVEQTILLRQ